MMSSRCRTGSLNRGRIRGDSGFTLIELMVVTLIIGILAAVMIPRMDEARDRSYFSSIGNDLRNMGASQERHYQTSFQYSQNLGVLDFSPSPGVNLEVTEATSQGWAAVAWHSSLEDARGCAIYLGNAVAPPLPNGAPHSLGPGTVQCTN